MGNLPNTRLSPSRPFSISGVDYAGPFLIKDRKGCNYKTSKAYIALFVFFVTKATHLEFSHDRVFYDRFIHFMSLRGKGSQIYSDHCTTFIGERERELRILVGYGNLQ